MPQKRRIDTAPAAGRRPTLIAITPRVRWFGLLILAIVLVLIFHAAPGALAILLGGFTLALVLAFPIRFFEHYMKRSLAILLTFVLVFGLVGLALFAVVPALIDQLTALTNDWPELSKKGSNLLQQVLAPLQQRGWITGTPEDLINQAQQTLASRAQELAQQLLTILLSGVKGVLNVLLTIFGSILLAVYFLVDARKIKAAYLRAVPKKYRPDAAELWSDFAESLSRYIAGLFAIILVQGVVSTIALTVLRIPYSIVLGAWVSVTAILPVLGAWLGAIPAVIVTAVFMEPWRILAVIGVYVAIQQLEGNLLTPRIQGHALRVHAIIVFLAVVAGGELAGLPGALFAVPALAIIRVLLDFLRARLRVVNPLPAPVQLVEQEVVIIEPPAPAPALPTDSD